MKRFPIDFAASVCIDGVVRDQRTLWCHEQTDPYPGRHRYEALLTGAAAFEHFRGLPQTLAGQLDRDESKRILALLYSTFEAPEEGIPCEFVLNTIDTVRATADTLCIGGECSPFVHAPGPE